ncbi:MAG: VCBS repeat-containing protein [Planctomycetes bacterium]|nr:VCBS repeat-containing protein [Planctomycetota bacterium]
MSCPRRPSRVVHRDAARAALPLALATLLAGRAAAQQEAWRIDGVQSLSHLGAALCWLPDADGDGIAELVAGVPAELGASGSIRGLSGATFAELFEWTAPSGDPDFGRALVAVDDQDGDGREDLWVGSAGRAELVSSATGAKLHEVHRSYSASFGSALFAADDVDGDGRQEVVVGAPEETLVVAGGIARLFSSKNGALLLRLVGSSEGAELGGRGRVALVDDVDGDGCGDLALLDREDVGGWLADVVRLVSSRSGNELQVVRFDRPDDRAWVINTLAATGDLDGDGERDVVLGVKSRGAARASVRALSLRTGVVRWSAPFSPSLTEVVVSGSAGDFDGDGIDEIAVVCYAGLPGFERWSPHWTPTEQTSGVPQRPYLPQPSRLELALIRASDGQRLHGMGLDLPYREAAIPTFLAGGDLDGDARADVVVADPAREAAYTIAGAVTGRRWTDGAPILQAVGEAKEWMMDGAIAVLGDHDGDGRREVVTSYFGANGEYAGSQQPLRLFAGRSGRRVGGLTAWNYPITALAAVPDLDGDGRDDLALTVTPGAHPWVEVRSTATSAKLVSYYHGNDWSTFGAALAVGVQPASGAVQIAISETISGPPPYGIDESGRVVVVDVATGALLFEVRGVRKFEQLGSAVAYVGDVDGDGVGDWATGAQYNSRIAPQAGRVALISGVAGALLAEQYGSAASEEFGSAIAALGDVDGDGVPDFAATALGAGAQSGVVRAYSSATLTLLFATPGSAPGDRFGQSLIAMGDLDGDGRGDWAAIGSLPPRIEVRSGFDGALLARFASDATRTPRRITTTAAWQSGSPSGDALRDLFVSDDQALGGLGSAWLIVLDDLLLQIEPASPKPNDTVFAYLRGAPSGNAALLELVAIDGVPVSVTLDAGVFDAEREWFTCGAVPPGLSGTTWTLRGHATGWSGGLVQSLDQELTFE